jgi:hypothetical protein
MDTIKQPILKAVQQNLWLQLLYSADKDWQLAYLIVRLSS